MVNEKEFRKQIKSAYNDDRPAIKRYLLILAVLIAAFAVVLVLESASGPQNTAMSMEALAENSKNIVSNIRGILP